MYLSQSQLREDPRNHAVPILDTFDDDDDDSVAYIVMPLLREIYEPPFMLVRDVVDFVDQVLEVQIFNLMAVVCLWSDRVPRALLSCMNTMSRIGRYSTLDILFH